MKQIFLYLFFSCWAITSVVAQPPLANAKEITIGKLSNGSVLLLKKSTDNKWGLYLNNAGLSSVAQTAPAQIEIYLDSLHISKHSSGYHQVNKITNGFTGKAIIKTENASFTITDQWKIIENLLQLRRNQYQQYYFKFFLHN